MINHCSGWGSFGPCYAAQGCSPSTTRFHRSEISMSNIDELKNTGLKATVPRLKILEIFQAGKQRHMTAEDVFRVLTQFEQAGLLNRNNFESGKAVFEINEGQHHDHLVCLDCGKVEEFYDAEIENRQNAVATAKGFAIADHALSIYANCTKDNCPNRGATPLHHHHS
jgi:Fur family ferric uptake transcriptional regulator